MSAATPIANGRALRDSVDDCITNCDGKQETRAVSAAPIANGRALSLTASMTASPTAAADKTRER